ncbi:MAG: helix-turn-helix domain-containing protein [Bacteroidota bacterium]
MLIAAKRLLRFSELQNKEIAYELGFSAPANFSQFFKKCTGVSPSKFRAQI